MWRAFDPPVKVSVLNRIREPRAHLTAKYFPSGKMPDKDTEPTVVRKEIEKDVFLRLYERSLRLDMDRMFESDDESGLDGSSWTISIHKMGHSISLSMFYPTSDTKERGMQEFVDLCNSLLELAGVDIPEDVYY